VKTVTSTLQKIRDFAERSHGDQMRKFSPEPYIEHPVRVMQTCAEHTNDVCILSAALLHDVLEDTEVSSEELLAYLQKELGEKHAARTFQIVEELTDVYVKKNYPQWNRRKRKQKETIRLEKVSEAAQTIKYADIIDNSLTIVGAEPDFRKKYLQECRALLLVLKKGSPSLHERATTVVTTLLAADPQQ
jgi:(p)ppGpp synthase/HD superfamily hydrolase